VNEFEQLEIADFVLPIDRLARNLQGRDNS